MPRLKIRLEFLALRTIVAAAGNYLAIVFWVALHEDYSDFSVRGFAHENVSFKGSSIVL